MAFTNVLLGKLPTLAPSVNTQQVAATGVTDLRSVFPADAIPGIVDAYMDGLKVTYAIAITTVGISVLISFASKWRNLKGKIPMGGGAA